LGRAFFVVLSSAVDRLTVGFFGGAAVGWTLDAVFAAAGLGAGFATDVGVAVALVGVVGSALGAAFAVVPPGFAVAAFVGFAAGSAAGASGFAGVVAFRPSIAGFTGLRVSMGALLTTARVGFALGAAVVASAELTFVGSTAALLATAGLVLDAVRSSVGAALATGRAGVVGAFDFACGLAATGATGAVAGVAGVAGAFGSGTTGVGRGAWASAGSAFDAATRVALAFGFAIVASTGMGGEAAGFGVALGRAAVCLGFAIVSWAGITGVVSAFDATLARVGVAFGHGLAVVASAGMTGAAAAGAALAAAVPLTFGLGVGILASAGTIGVAVAGVFLAAAFGGVVAAAFLVAGLVGGLTTAEETFAVGLMIVALLGFASGAAALASVANAASATACLARAASRRRRSVLAGAEALPTASAGTVAPSRAPTGWRTVSSSEISAADVRRLHQNAAVVAGNPIPTMP
jgi:hypothetical protein